MELTDKEDRDADDEAGEEVDELAEDATKENKVNAVAAPKKLEAAEVRKALLRRIK